MCRIVGFVDFNQSHVDLYSVITSMRDTMTHGGPDDAGYHIEASHHLALGHRRLSVLDLSHNGHQPMSNQNQTIWITYNGEIYNFKFLRQQLSSKGYLFQSQTDTEVILAAYQEWGTDCVKKFHGMWAFCIWDSTQNTLFLSRDRVGVKPLYWYFHNGLFIFGSELKSLMAHPHFEKSIHPEALSYYLQYGYISPPHCIFKNTHKLNPGHHLFLDFNQTITITPYWKPTDTSKTFSFASESDVLDQLDDILTTSFQMRMIADVPVGIFLSGGIDSTLVTAILQKKSLTPLHTFTIGFEEAAFDESPYAKRISNYLGTKHTQLICSSKEALGVIPKLPYLYDEPMGDSTAIPTFLVSQLAKKHVKVALSAEGGDELFGGYTHYRKLLLFNQLMSKFSFLKHAKYGVKFLRQFLSLAPSTGTFNHKLKKWEYLLEAPTLLKKYDLLNHYFYPDELAILRLPFVSQIQQTQLSTPLSQLLHYDITTFLPEDILAKVDRATMGVSLEGREPFLDQTIIEFAHQLPDHYKINGTSTKYILRQLLARYIPSHYFDRPKQGFLVPMMNWVSGDLKELCVDHLKSEKFLKLGIINPKDMDELIKTTLSRGGFHHKKAWFLINLSLWCDTYL